MQYQTTVNEKQRAAIEGIPITFAILEKESMSSVGNITGHGMRAASRKRLSKKTRLEHERILEDYSCLSDLKLTTREIHVGAQFHQKVKLLISYRLASYLAVQKIFETVLEPEMLARHQSIEFERTVFIYSIRLFYSEKQTRFEFLDIVSVLFLKYKSIHDLKVNKDALKALWPSPDLFNRNLFMSCTEFTKKNLEEHIVNTFQWLQEHGKLSSRTIRFKNIHNDEIEWKILQAVIFSQLLTRTTNEEMKMSVMRRLNTPYFKRRFSEREVGTVNYQEAPAKKHRKSSSQLSNEKDESTDSAKEEKEDTTSDEESDDGSTGTGESKDTTGNDLLSSIDHQDEKMEEVKDEDVDENETVAKQNECKDRSLDSRAYQQNVIDQLLKEENTRRMIIMSYHSFSRKMKNNLIIQVPGINVILQSYTTEAYFATNLDLHMHKRETTRPRVMPTDFDKKVTLFIPPTVNQFLDKQDIIDVLRPQSVLFQKHKPVLKRVDFRCILQTTLKVGKVDNVRSQQQYRVNIGNGGLDLREGKPAELVGTGCLDGIDPKAQKQYRKSIGNVAKFLCYCMNDIQTQMKRPPLAVNRERWEKYCLKLARFFLIKDDARSFFAENVTVVVGTLVPGDTIVKAHVDLMNDTMYSYSKTCTLSFVIEYRNTVFSLQVILNFRKTICQHCMPYKSIVQKIKENIEVYLKNLQDNYDQCFPGNGIEYTRITPGLYASFFLDNTMTKTVYNIGEGDSVINQELITPMIGPSRLMSWSMSIEPLVMLRKQLSRRQLMELAFIGSLLNTQLRFHHVLMHLASSDMQFNEHPIYDWFDTSVRMFNDKIQGGGIDGMQRYSPHPWTANDFRSYFGGTNDEQTVSKKRIVDILIVLDQLLQWMDEDLFYVTEGKTHAEIIQQITHQKLMRKYEETVALIPKELDFGLFRCSVFLTLCTGCGLLKPGKHLLHIHIPTPNTAAYKHLVSPFSNEIDIGSIGSHCNDDERSRPRISNQSDQETKNNKILDTKYLDEVMIEVSNELRRPFPSRGEIDVMLCESKPGRFLNKKDTFIVGGSIFFLNEEGRTIMRKFGRDTEWEELLFKDDIGFHDVVGIDDIVYTRKDDTLAAIISDINTRDLDLSGLRPEVYVRTQDKPPNIMDHRYAHIDYYSSQYISKISIDFARAELIHINDGPLQKKICEYKEIEKLPGGERLVNYMFKNGLEIQVVAEHIALDSEKQEQQSYQNTISQFAFHQDKHNLSRATFLPIAGESIAIIVVPHETEYEDDSDLFELWLGKQNNKTKRDLSKHLKQGKRKESKFKNAKLLKFFLEPGKLLSFRASELLHGSIIPKQNTRRILWICYDLVVANN